MSNFGVSTGTPTASIDVDLRLDQRQDDVEVVNHQVEHDVDVEAALGKRAEPMDLDEPRRRDERQHGGDRRVVALGVADGQRRARRRGRGDQRVGLGERCAPSASRPAPAMPRSRNGSAIVAMQLGRHRDDDRVDLAEQLAVVGQRARCRSPRRSPRRAPASVSTTAVEPHALERRQDARVVPAEVADADRRATRDSGISARRHAASLPRGRPTIAMPASLADANTARRRAPASARRRSTAPSRRRAASPRSSRRR